MLLEYLTQHKASFSQLGIICYTSIHCGREHDNGREREKVREEGEEGGYHTPLSAWGLVGQCDGSDASKLPLYDCMEETIL